MQIIFPGISYSSALEESGVLSLHERREFLSNKLFNDIVISSKHALKSLLPPKSSCYTEHLRTRRTFELPEIHTNRFRNSFIMHYVSKHSDKYLDIGGGGGQGKGGYMVINLS